MEMSTKIHDILPYLSLPQIPMDVNHLPPTAYHKREKEGCHLSSSGELIAQVYTSRAQIPIPGATVAITQPISENRHHWVGLRITNENGKIPPLELPTPPPAESITPEGDIPYTPYDIWVQAPGFEIQWIQGVQIFPETTTLQKVELIPLPEHTPLRSRGETYEIPPQNL